MLTDQIDLTLYPLDYASGFTEFSATLMPGPSKNHEHAAQPDA